jgi:hypothetical protein
VGTISTREIPSSLILSNRRRTDVQLEAEDRQYAKGQRGDELPPELARRESRLKKIREAKEALEAEQLHELSKSTSELGSDLHTLSHRLHSSTLESLGLFLLLTLCAENSLQARHQGPLFIG